MSVTVSGSLGALTVAEATRVSHAWNMVNTAVNGEVGLWQSGIPSNGGMFNNQGIAAAWALVDGRACKVIRPSLAQIQQSDIRLGAVGFGVPFRPTFANGGPGSLQAAGGERDLCSVWQSWLKKFNNVDQTSVRQCFGFYNANAAFGTASRVGLLGDGVTGFRFASARCPDGGAGAVALGAFDANSVQPLSLINPGLQWFHVRIKMIPATPESPGRVACYLNGQLVALFDQVANLPRGNNGASTLYAPLIATIAADFDGVVQLGGFHSYDQQFWYDKDYNL